MKNASVVNALRWLLAAWMLLATSAMPSWAHDHGDGYFSCRHTGADCCVQGCSLAPAFCGDHDDNASLSDDGHEHGFLRLLLENPTYPPSSEQPSVPYDSSKCGWCAWLRTISIAKNIRISPKDSTLGQILLSGLTSVWMDGLGEPSLRMAFCSSDAPSFSLCDRARHERSGVQLI